MRALCQSAAVLGLASITLLAACEGSTLLPASPTAPAASGLPATALDTTEDTAPASQALAPSCAGDAAQSRAMEDAVNAVRSVEGKTSLRNHPLLAEIAQSHACDMVRMGRATVAGSNGSNVVDRARAAGYPTCGVVQLVQVGGAPGSVVNGWLTSGPHREQVLGQLSTGVGAGVAIGPDGRPWWSVVIGHNCNG